MSGARGGGRGALAMVLHTHMPYVEGFGTWPFGEEWLWEAIASCYLPLLDLLDERQPDITLSITPVLADQLAVPGLAGRFERFVEQTRRFTHAEDAAGLRRGGHVELAAELERAWREDYERAVERMRERGGDLVGAFARHASWTSTATHAVLPLIATDACARAQIQTGIAAYEDRLASPWDGGMWLPECAYAPCLEPALARAGVRRICVERTRELAAGDPAHLRPIASAAGIVLYPIDRHTIELVWSDGGYPADGAYRDYHRHTVHHHNPWRNDGSAYDRQLALSRARTHARHFVGRVGERLARDGRDQPGGGLVVCAMDTELLGHWWYEGVDWLRAVIEECARQRVRLVRLDDALERFEPEPTMSPCGSVDRPGAAEPSTSAAESGASKSGCADRHGAAELGVSSWGRDNDLSTWSGPAVADMCWQTRRAELQVLRAATAGAVGQAAIRELLALQASDWPFMVTRGLAVPYALERFEGHRARLARALAAGAGAPVEHLGELAGCADPAMLLAP